MTDKEKRAHDLAVSYVLHKNILEFFEESSLKMIAFESDYYTDYDMAYEAFLNLIPDE